jgi:hypothetical protein
MSISPGRLEDRSTLQHEAHDERRSRRKALQQSGRKPMGTPVSHFVAVFVCVVIQDSSFR